MNRIITRSTWKAYNDWQDKMEIDRQHRLNVAILGYCMACGLPHNTYCQCQTWEEEQAGRIADAEYEWVSRSGYVGH